MQAGSGHGDAVGKSRGEMKGNRKKTAKKTTTTAEKDPAAAVGKSGEATSSSSSKKQRIDERQQEEDGEEEAIRISHGNGPERDEEGGISMNLTDPNVLDCSICMEPLTPPIFQCDNGHIACSTCCTKIANKCPSCSRPIGHIRCLAIENIIESIKISCKNAQYGCKVRVIYAKKLNHEETCIYAPCACPLSDCTFYGSCEQLSLHLSRRHWASVRRFCYNCTFPVSVDKSEQFLVFQGEDGLLFLLNNRTEIIGNALSVTCIGTSSSKRGFFYDIISRRGSSSLKLQSYTKFARRQTEDSPMDFLLIPNDFSGLLGPLKFDVCIWSSREYSSEQVSTQQTDIMHSRNVANSNGDDQSSMTKKCAGCGELGLGLVQTWGYCNHCPRVVGKKGVQPRAADTTAMSPIPPRTRGRARNLLATYDTTCFRSEAAAKRWEEIFKDRDVEPGRVVRAQEFAHLFDVGARFEAIGWSPILKIDTITRPSLVKLFYANLTVHPEEDDAGVTRCTLISKVKGVDIKLNEQNLVDGFGFSQTGEDTYWSPMGQMQITEVAFADIKQVVLRADRPLRRHRPKQIDFTEADMQDTPRIISRIIQHNVVPKGGHRDEVTSFQTFLTYAVLIGRPINLPYIILQTMAHATHSGRAGNLPYGKLLTYLFESVFGVDLTGEEPKEPENGMPLGMTTLRRMQNLQTDIGPPVRVRRRQRPAAVEAEYRKDVEGDVDMTLPRTDVGGSSTQRQSTIESLRAHIDTHMDSLERHVDQRLP